MIKTMSVINNIQELIKIVDDLREAFSCINYTFENWNTIKSLPNKDIEKESNQGHAESTASTIIDMAYDLVDENSQESLIRVSDSSVFCFNEKEKLQFIKDVQTAGESKVKVYEERATKNILTMMAYSIGFEVSVEGEGTYHDVVSLYDIKFKPNINLRDFFKALHKTFVYGDRFENLSEVKYVNENKMKITVNH
jgi:hypothetical protein